MIERRVVHYRGRVQGVGFRYTTRRIATRFDVAGYVKNLPDGRVEVVAEGEGGEIERFLDEVSTRMTGYIHDCQQRVETAQGVGAGFSIEF
jgi:acylphosphatase